MKKIYTAPVVEVFKKHQSGLLVSNLGRVFVPKVVIGLNVLCLVVNIILDIW